MKAVLKTPCISAHRELPDKATALGEIAAMVAGYVDSKAVTDADVLKGLKTREALGSTGFGNGIAIPHCRLKGIRDFVAGIITCPAGVDFNALDGEPVRLLVFIIAPEERAEDHIRLLAAISRALTKPAAVAGLVAAPSAEALQAMFLALVQPEAEAEAVAGAAEPISYAMVQVIVQDEELFRDILQVLTSGHTVGTTVVEGKNSSAFLSRMPLFADFWRDAPPAFCRLILTVIDSALTNDTVRRIERVTGPLSRRGDILLTVQELTRAAGGLGA